MDAADHEQVIYDLTEWTDDQRGAFDLMLTGAEVAHGWDGSHLLVPHPREAQVDDLMEAIEKGDIVEEGHGRTAESSNAQDAGRLDIAGAGRRLLGYVVDAGVLGALSVAVGQGVLHLEPSSPIALRLVLPALIGGYMILTTARWGRTLGKLVVGTRVIALADGSVPGWQRATVRWTVQVGPTFVAFLATGGAATRIILALVPIVWMIVVNAGVLRSPMHQGLHDRAAGTVVVVLR